MAALYLTTEVTPDGVHVKARIEGDPREEMYILAGPGEKKFTEAERWFIERLLTLTVLAMFQEQFITEDDGQAELPQKHHVQGALRDLAPAVVFSLPDDRRDSSLLAMALSLTVQ